jgi:6-phosphogluconate dehydrogenase
MQLAMVGLGRMGANLVRRLMRRQHECVVFDRDAAAVDALAREGARPARALDDLVSQLSAPWAVWVMLPHGAATESTIAELARLLSAGDAVIDGGNGHHHDDVRRAHELAARRIDYLDIGTSGGVWGLERGYCLMIGGAAAAVQRLAPLFDALAPGVGVQPRTRGGDVRSV